MSVSVPNKRDHDTSAEAARRRLGSAGWITPGVELIKTDDDGRPSPIGTPGEIWIRLRATIPGYYRDPEATAAEFSNGFWKSGDLGYVDDGGSAGGALRQKPVEDLFAGPEQDVAVLADAGERHA